MKKAFVVIAGSLLVFLSLVFYNYLSAQKAIREEKTSITKLMNLTYPESIEIGSSASFVWKVEVPSGLSTENTSLYWGYESTPSALKDYDSPQAVGYPNHPTDYEAGEFPLPSDFSVTITPDKIGKVYFRSYALVQGRHLWTDESSFTVTTKTNARP